MLGNCLEVAAYNAAYHGRPNMQQLRNMIELTPNAATFTFGDDIDAKKLIDMTHCVVESVSYHSYEHTSSTWFVADMATNQSNVAVLG